MDDNYGPALTDHSRHFIEWRVENKKIAGVFFFFPEQQILNPPNIQNGGKKCASNY